ncbi:hypothetical protein E2C01_072155 [Portunus trituberculatus]|uniref:Uncharacterized protein n=1 Tax=Portunus trituberculatus TaxID=210409 RepID=A0A5B7I5Z0_PORTR|nr:hypothetical protein [Portunus trituberculatus]
MRRPTNETPRPTRRCTRPVPVRRPPGGDVQCALSSVSCVLCPPRPVRDSRVLRERGEAERRGLVPCRRGRSAAPRCLCHPHIVTVTK